MEPENLTLRVLREIRDAVVETNARLDQTNARLDQTNARLDQTNARLDQTREELSQRIVESELRTATAITELASAVGGVRDLLREQLDLRPRVERCEADIRELKSRHDT
jgi:predicted  nucleic acid-binding Zn-ribbon protein